MQAWHEAESHIPAAEATVEAVLMAEAGNRRRRGGNTGRIKDRILGEEPGGSQRRRDA